MRRWLAAGLALSLLGALVLWIGRSHELIALVRAVAPGALVILVVVSGVGLLVQSLQFAILSRLFGVRLQPQEAIGLTCVNNAMSYSVPVHGGTLVRAAYLWRVHGLTLHRYVALTVSSHVVILGVVAVVAATVMLTQPAPTDPHAALLWVAFAAAPVLLGAGVWLLTAMAERLTRILPGLGGHATAIADGLRAWRAHPAGFWRFVGVTIIVYLAHAARLLVALRAVGERPSLAAALLLQAAAAFSVVLSVTPANLGTREGVLVIVAGNLGLDAGGALVAALLDRAVGATEAVVGAVAVGRRLLRRIGTGGERDSAVPR